MIFHLDVFVVVIDEIVRRKLKEEVDVGELLLIFFDKLKSFSAKSLKEKLKSLGEFLIGVVNYSNEFLDLRMCLELYVVL